MKQSKILVTDIVGMPYDDIFRTLLKRWCKLATMVSSLDEFIEKM